ncbi:MAG: amidohydrolase family protein [Acidimicrobiales bacterium]|nr:amidohydrolase family protein [Acidimicrobiales bacterium]
MNAEADSTRFDLLIRNGTVVDGTGADRHVADVGVRDGVVAAVGDLGRAEADEVIDATDCIVIPGFVDVHTHYDGQVTWDPVLEPSASHGVTTIVTGNCGVGFAPVKPGTEDWLIQLMEGVEDIPGAALSEGIDWTWETFPEYLDNLDGRAWGMDVGCLIAHGAVRSYVMGERGAKNEAANAEEIEAMRGIVREAVEAGALGVSTSRTIAHTAMDGEPVPGTFAAEDELYGLARGCADAGHGLLELAPMGSAGEDVVAPHKEVDWMVKISKDTGVPVSFVLVQINDEPQLWKELMDRSIAAVEEGASLHPQIAGRLNGILLGLEGLSPWRQRPSFDEIADLPLDELVAELGRPERRAAILSEVPDTDNPFSQFILGSMHRIYVLGDPPDYEPGPDRTIKAIAEGMGREVEDLLYDMLLEDDGRTLLLFPFLNYADGNGDALREMLTHPAGVIGLSDGGAHCGVICDASQPTWLLTHWARDRSRGEKLPLEFIVKKQTHDTARLFGFADRGTLEVGAKADINVVDLENLTLEPPKVARDLPAGGKRFVQFACGYKATIVSGVVTCRDDTDTGARPGRLVRATS